MIPPDVRVASDLFFEYLALANIADDTPPYLAGYPHPEDHAEFKAAVTVAGLASDGDELTEPPCHDGRPLVFVAHDGLGRLRVVPSEGDAQLIDARLLLGVAELTSRSDRLRLVTQRLVAQRFAAQGRVRLRQGDYDPLWWVPPLGGDYCRGGGPLQSSKAGPAISIQAQLERFGVADAARVATDAQPLRLAAVRLPDWATIPQ